MSHLSAPIRFTNMLSFLSSSAAQFTEGLVSTSISSSAVKVFDCTGGSVS